MTHIIEWVDLKQRDQWVGTTPGQAAPACASRWRPAAWCGPRLPPLGHCTEITSIKMTHQGQRCQLHRRSEAHDLNLLKRSSGQPPRLAILARSPAATLSNRQNMVRLCSAPAWVHGACPGRRDISLGRHAKISPTALLKIGCLTHRPLSKLLEETSSLARRARPLGVMYRMGQFS